MSELREDLLNQLAVAAGDELREVGRRIGELVGRYELTPAERAVLTQALGYGERAMVDAALGGGAALDPVGGGVSVFDLSQSKTWAFAQVYRRLAGSWSIGDRRTLGAVLKTAPPDVVEDVVGVLRWAGLVEPPDGVAPVVIFAPPAEEG